MRTKTKLLKTQKVLNKAAVYWVIAAVYGLTAVILGALGTHAFGLDNQSHEYVLFQHAYTYQLIHALLLIWIVSQLEQGAWVRFAAVSISLGVLLFCGGLYLLVFVGKSAWSIVTPIGGSLLILGWLNLVIHGFLRIKKRK